jgi:stress-induced-phosphoprotein 1
MTTAEEYKALGNDALKARNFSKAIENYTSAINLDGSNQIYYSNRSAAYLSKGDGENALEDAKSCIALNPQFSKGYVRKGAALHHLKRYNDSVKAYEDGLALFPGDDALTKGLESVKKERDGGSGASSGGRNPMSALFGPQMMAQIAMDPKLRGYMSDPDFMAKIQLLQKDPNQLSSMLGDDRIMEVFQAILGMNGMNVKTEEDLDREIAASKSSPPKATSTSPKTSNTSTESKKEDTKQPMEVEEEEDLSQLEPEERKIRENKKVALKAKERGNELYKAKKFDEALAAYDEAITIDDTNMTFIANKSAVYFTMKKYDECIDACKKAFEVGKENRAPFEERAKVLSRCAKAYQKKGDLASAIEMCQNAQLESFDKDTQRFMKTMELEKKKTDALAYQDDEKAEEAKQLGNTHFRNKEFGDAVKAYEEAVKRAPKNAPIRNNLAAALCKVMDFNGAKREIEIALEIDPKYVKALVRKAEIEVYMKEYHKAMESYKKGLELEPTNAACKEGLRKVSTMINYGQANMTDDERRERAAHAMADPEIQAILTDPIINQVLKDFQENPTAANEAMRDVGVRAKIEKLIASGILQTA